MSEARVTQLLEAYGADARRWPAAERALAARAPAPALAAEAALDRALDLDRTAVDIEAFAARAMAAFAPPAEVVALAARRPPRRLRPIWALAACAVLGVAIGFGAGRAAPDDSADQALAAAFTDFAASHDASGG